MAFRKSSELRPQILEVSPDAAIPGGEFQVRGKNFARAGNPAVTIGAAPASLVVGSDSYLIVRVPDGVASGEMIVGHNGDARASLSLQVGVATGIVFDPEGNLYVGDRSGTIFKVSRQRQIYVFATLESSISAYHLAL